MRKLRKIVLIEMLAHICAGTTQAAIGTSAEFKISIGQDGVFQSTGNETLTYSSLWDGDSAATVTIKQDGETLASGLIGAGEQEWNVSRNGTYMLTHTTYTNGVVAKVETVTFNVTNAEVIPEIAADATATVVDAAIDEVGFADSGVKVAIGGNAVEYGKFKEWAQSVKSAGSASSAAAGEVAVVANTNTAAAYLLGSERLFENAPRVELGLEFGNWDSMALPISVTVLDGDEAVKCTAEKVKEMFEATSDLGDWNGAAKLTPIVSVEDGEGTTIRFTVTPGDGTATQAFLRIRK